MSDLSEVQVPTTELAAAAAHALREMRKQPAPTAKQISLRIDDEPTAIEVPRPAFELFLRILAEMANGNAVTIVPVHAELTTQQAAALLNVSRPYLIKLLDEGKIAFKKIGNRRRVLFADLYRYKQEVDARRETVFHELAAEAQKLNLDY